MSGGKLFLFTCSLDGGYREKVGGIVYNEGMGLGEALEGCKPRPLALNMKFLWLGWLIKDHMRDNHSR